MNSNYRDYLTFKYDRISKYLSNDDIKKNLIDVMVNNAKGALDYDENELETIADFKRQIELIDEYGIEKYSMITAAKDALMKNFLSDEFALGADAFGLSNKTIRDETMKFIGHDDYHNIEKNIAYIFYGHCYKEKDMYAIDNPKMVAAVLAVATLEPLLGNYPNLPEVEKSLKNYDRCLEACEDPSNHKEVFLLHNNYNRNRKNSFSYKGVEINWFTEDYTTRYLLNPKQLPINWTKEDIDISDTIDNHDSEIDISYKVDTIATFHRNIWNIDIDPYDNIIAYPNRPKSTFVILKMHDNDHPEINIAFKFSKYLSHKEEFEIMNAMNNAIEKGNYYISPKCFDDEEKFSFDNNVIKELGKISKFYSVPKENIFKLENYENEEELYKAYDHHLTEESIGESYNHHLVDESIGKSYNHHLTDKLDREEVQQTIKETSIDSLIDDAKQSLQDENKTSQSHKEKDDLSL